MSKRFCGAERTTFDLDFLDSDAQDPAGAAGLERAPQRLHRQRPPQHHGQVPRAPRDQACKHI